MKNTGTKNMMRAGLIVLLCGLLLVACGDDDPAPAATSIPPTASPTAETIIPTAPAATEPAIPAVPLPTPTIATTPTLSYDIVLVAGDWSLRFDIAITGGTFFDRLIYTGAATVSVGIDGAITGGGYLTPNVFDDTCVPRVLDNGSLTFTVRGNTRLEGDQIRAGFEIVPDFPDREENYALICPDVYNDVRYSRVAILWPALTSLNRLQWDLALQPGQSIPFESDIPEGHLMGEAYFAQD